MSNALGPVEDAMTASALARRVGGLPSASVHQEQISCSSGNI